MPANGTGQAEHPLKALVDDHILQGGSESDPQPGRIASLAVRPLFSHSTVSFFSWRLGRRMSRTIESTAPDQGLPHPAISPPPNPPQNRLAVSFRKSRWKAFKDAIRIGTGYASKPPEWSGSTLDFGNHQGNTGDEEDGVLESDDLNWISGQDGGDNLALVLVERSHSATSQGSPNPNSSQDNIPNYHPSPAYHNGTDNANDYRLKGYENSLHGTHTSVTAPFTWLWYRTIPWLRRAFLRYCYPEFYDPQVENVYAERLYESQKFLAFICSAWLVISWLIAVTLLVPKNLLLSDTIFFYGIAPALSVPLPFMIFYDVPKRLPHFYQVFLVTSVWSWSAYTVAFMQLCNYYGGGQAVFDCQGRDMVNLFYYMIALPVIALFGMGQQRIYATIAPLIMIITPTAFFYPKKNSWVRFALEHLFLQALLLYIHWRREILERNVFYVNKKVKDTLIALHQTRLHQSRVEAARARSTSYIFHEVRQPLSAAFLAYQNLAASTSIRPEQRFEWDTLRLKLMSMSKLLNDVLDQKRMDAGKFEIVSRPFSFHSIVRQTIFGSQIAADRKDQELIVELDKNIDRVARIGMYYAQRKSSDEIQRLLNESPDEEAVLVGDETRLSQVLNNLISNSSKFTPANGKIRVSTRLISPRSPRARTSSVTGSTSPRFWSRTTSQPLLTPPESRTGAALQNLLSGGSTNNRWEDDPDRVVVRIEVIDTGCGISPSDVKERRLFSPYAQAGVGRFQGGSGTGLGLSLVRRIVKLMGGRMGVESVPAAGTTFWVELPLRIANSPILPTVESMLAAPSITALQVDSEPTVTPASSATIASPPIIMTPPPLVSPVSSYTSARPSSAHPSEKPDLGHSDTTGSVPISLFSARSSTNESVPKAPKIPTREHSTSIQSSTGVGLSVLVVDDDPILRGLLQRLLVRLGCEVEGAENGQIALRKLGMVTEEALVSENKPDPVPEGVGLGPVASTSGANSSAASKHTYDVVFLDNQMPTMNGPEVATTLRRNGRRDFLVGLSGDSNVLDQERFRQAGVDEFLSKPVLESQVKKVLQTARERRTSKNPPAGHDHQPP